MPVLIPWQLALQDVLGAFKRSWIVPGGSDDELYGPLVLAVNPVVPDQQLRAETGDER